MKYVGFYEMDQDDKYKVFELDDKIGAEQEKDPEKWHKKYGKCLGAYFLGMESKGMAMFEFDEPMQMINMERVFWPYKRWKFVPLLDVEMVKESYKKSKEEQTSN